MVHFDSIRLMEIKKSKKGNCGLFRKCAASHSTIREFDVIPKSSYLFQPEP